MAPKMVRRIEGQITVLATLSEDRFLCWFMLILCWFWSPFGSLLAPLWLHRAPFGSLWAPFGSLLAPFGLHLGGFGSLLAPFWLHFVKFGDLSGRFGLILVTNPIKRMFLVTPLLNLMFFGYPSSRSTCRSPFAPPSKEIFLACMPFPPGPERELAVGNLDPLRAGVTPAHGRVWIGPYLPYLGFSYWIFLVDFSSRIFLLDFSSRNFPFLGFSPGKSLRNMFFSLGFSI